MKQLDRFFRLSQRGTTLGRELRGGCTTFCSMVYLILVIPGLLSGAGMDFETVMTATCLIAAAGSIVSGLVSNLPFALAPRPGLYHPVYPIPSARSTAAPGSRPWRRCWFPAFCFWPSPSALCGGG